MTDLFLSALAYFFVYIAIEIVAARISRSLSLMKRVVSTFIIFLLLASIFGPAQGLSQYMFLIFSFGIFWLIYVEVLVCAQNSVSLLLLSRLAESASGKMQLTELSARDKHENSVQVRVEAMVASGFLITTNGGQISLSPAAKKLAESISLARRLIRGGVGDR
jgi:hypothetical protein